MTIPVPKIPPMTPGRWILGNDTGVSSQTIWAVMMNEATAENIKEMSVSGCYFDIPHDPDDFGRCYRLLLHFPEWRARIKEMGNVFPKWKPMADCWNQLEGLYLEESPDGRCPQLYARMRELVAEGMLLDGWEKKCEGLWTKTAA